MRERLTADLKEYVDRALVDVDAPCAIAVCDALIADLRRRRRAAVRAGRARPSTGLSELASQTHEALVVVTIAADPQWSWLHLAPTRAAWLRVALAEIDPAAATVPMDRLESLLGRYSRTRRRGRVTAPGVLAAVCIETGALHIPKHPDPTPEQTARAVDVLRKRGRERLAGHDIPIEIRPGG